MKKILIFGNSGSGKSTLAKNLKTKYDLAHLDLDCLAWLDTKPPQRKQIKQTASEIKQFTDQNSNWVIEGCYTDLLELVSDGADEIIFLNLGAETCIRNCQNRPWEPHKYSSKEEQDNNLQMLINWIKNYAQREDEFSLASHQLFFDNFAGKKSEYNHNLTEEI